MEYDLKESTSTLIKKASQLYIRLANTYLKELGIPHGYSYFLLQLWQEDGQTQTVLHKKIGIEQPTAVRTLDRMERDGFILRERSKEDRRIIKIFLTQKSKDLHAKSLKAARAMNNEALEGFSEADRKLLNKMLRDLIENLEIKLK
ncbi:hypothetical protein EP47_04100 [Legionella norrlandica]|uniref:HTH marR-type domain-containing protein n=1 Tax=Legionella norrlandica TaxID=1498499 RepID=A0A0A2T9Y4_9GAMM|nr:MarR family transcriptional regulator [Legionella norrlandica]KGP64243.1 hypothetical protein EP47_04100 [Legionella norrlandica]